MEGPMGPRGLGSKTIKVLKSLEIMKNIVFFDMEKMRIAILRSTERQLQIIDMVICGANCVFGNW